MPYRFLRFPNGRAKAVTLSYDDGSCYDEKLLDIINRYGLKCTFNLNSARIGAKDALTATQVYQLLDQGHEVAVHGANHLASGIVRPVEGIRDILKCREYLEQTFSRIIRGMAYADTGIRHFIDGNCYENVRQYLTDLGIVYSRTIGGDNDCFDLPSDWFAWMPTAHHANPKLPEYMESFLNLDISSLYCADQHPRLFYLWGHSHEFHFSDNWHLLERIGQTLGCRDDIWYATNIEIYDYVTSYHSLVWSADSQRVYNPTLIPVWFTVGSKMYCVHSGETVEIRS